MAERGIKIPQTHVASYHHLGRGGCPQQGMIRSDHWVDKWQLARSDHLLSTHAKHHLARCRVGLHPDTPFLLRICYLDWLLSEEGLQCARGHVSTSVWLPYSSRSQPAWAILIPGGGKWNPSSGRMQKRWLQVLETCLWSSQEGTLRQLMITLFNIL